MKKVLVTGASGGMGRKVIRELLRRDVQVVATSRDIEKARSLDFFEKVSFVPYDFATESRKDLWSYFGKPDTVIHLAWERLDNYNLKEHVEVFLEQHKKFIAGLFESGLKDFNGIGTCYECGLQEGLLQEGECQSEPSQPYSVAKNL